MNKTAGVAFVIAATFAASAWASAGGAAPPATSAPPTTEQLGAVAFPVSCNPAAQQEFNRAMARLHAFAFPAAQASFARVAEHDPACGMAHWGTSLASMGNPYAWSDDPGVSRRGAPAAALAAHVGAGTERERDYIAALGVLFDDRQTHDFPARAVAFEKAMAALAAKYPRDSEAQILYALALKVAAAPGDPGLARQAKAAAILEPLAKRFPSHPGVAHYLMHSYLAAGRGDRDTLPARTYVAGPAGAAYLSSEQWSRAGHWAEMVEAHRKAYLAAQPAPRAKGLGIGDFDALRALDHMVFAHLQQAQDQAARQLVEEAAAVSKLGLENSVAAYALAAVPARYALERGDWARAALLRLSPSDVAWEQYPHAEAILVFARALGAARIGELNDARRDVLRLEALREAMRVVEMPHWPEQAEAWIKTVEAWIAHAEMRHDEAQLLMRDAADLEDASERHPGSPGSVLPARELLGEMLLAQSQADAALLEFERALARDPDRFRGLYGAAQAAEAAGDRELAREYYARLEQVADARDSQRPELDDAEAFLAGRRSTVSGVVETQPAVGLAGEGDEEHGAHRAHAEP